MARSCILGCSFDKEGKKVQDYLALHVLPVLPIHIRPTSAKRGGLCAIVQGPARLIDCKNVAIPGPAVVPKVAYVRKTWSHFYRRQLT